jgi:hypothetical protein
MEELKWIPSSSEQFNIKGTKLFYGNTQIVATTKCTYK